MTWLGGKADPLGTVQEVEFLPYYLQKPETLLKNGTQKNLWDFETQTDPLTLAGRPV